jgi:subtilisin family serine protease
MQDASDAAYGANVLVVAASGNDGSTVDYPAAYDSVIAVGATDSSDNIAYFSNYGLELELSAPGVSIKSTWNDGAYNTISGTSMATPHVSGAAALAMEANPFMSVSEIRGLMQNTADDLGPAGFDYYFGFGLVDALFS